MRRSLYVLLGIASIAFTSATPVLAQPAFVNGIVIPGYRLDATGQPGANGGRFGFFSDIYYEPSTKAWWALSDRGPGGGLISYGTQCSASQSTSIPSQGRSRTSAFSRQSSSPTRRASSPAPAGD